MTEWNTIPMDAGWLGAGPEHAPFTFDGPIPVGLPRVPTGVDVHDPRYMVVNMGPQHPSTHGVLRMILALDGEEVVAGESVIGFLHRGIEKLSEHTKYDAIATRMDRGDYLSSIMNEMAYILAVEKLMDVEVPRRANWMRVLVSELNRLASHLVWYATYGLDVGGMGQFLYAFRDRERLLEILEELTGQRMLFFYLRVGGVAGDMTPRAEQMITSFLADFDQMLIEHDELLGGNEIFQARTKGVGVITREQAIGFGLSGANARSCGLDFDVRRDRPYAAYDEFEFDVPTHTAGDGWARYVVRMEEMRQSVRIIKQCMAGLPEGPVVDKVRKVIKAPAGEAYAAVESARGELGVYLVSDGGNSPYRLRYRPPSLYALQAAEAVLPGMLLADAVATLGGIDLVLGETDR